MSCINVVPFAFAQSLLGFLCIFGRFKQPFSASSLQSSNKQHRTCGKSFWKRTMTCSGPLQNHPGTGILFVARLNAAVNFDDVSDWAATHGATRV